jgi:NAD(P)-dependent dehydrogenase (short-subunit alcohol dehydrogenase family)
MLGLVDLQTVDGGKGSRNVGRIDNINRGSEGRHIAAKLSDLELMSFPFNSIYHATKWAIEGWSESMAFELNQFGIGIKTIEPGGIRTDFFTRSLDTARHPAYDALVNKFMGLITDPKQMETYSSPEQIAEVVYEAASDGKDQLRYVAGADAKAMYETRMQLGDEASRKAMAQQFFGDAPKAA